MQSRANDRRRTAAAVTAFVLWAGVVLTLTVPGLPPDGRDRAYVVATGLLNLPVVYLANRLRGHLDLDRATRRAWTMLCVAFSCAVLGTLSPVPTLTGLLYTVANLGGVAGLLMFPAAARPDWRRRLKQYLDAAIGFTGALMVYWAFVLAPRWTAAESTTERVTAMFALCLAFTCLVAAAGVLLGRPAPHIAVSVRMIALGVLLLFGVSLGADLFHATGVWLVLLQGIAGAGPVLFALAAAAQLRRTAAGPAHEEDDAEQTRAGVALTMAPYGLVLVGCSLMVWEVFRAAPPLLLRGLSILAMIASALVIARQGTALLETRRLSRALHRQANRDELTGALNRRALFTAANRMARERVPEAPTRPTVGWWAPNHSRRTAAPTVGVLLIDVDHFKHINDTYGHDTGDVALRSVVDALRSRLRGDDVVARLGGDEFVVLLPGTSGPHAAHLAGELQAIVQAIRLADGVGLTLSIGVAEFTPRTELLDAALDRADQALYQVKRAGRAGHRLYEGPATPGPDPARAGAHLAGTA